MLRYVTPFALLVTSACSEQTPIAPVSNEADGVNAIAAVEQLTPAQRDAVLFRAIRDAGLPCQSVSGATQTSASPTQTEWRARCEDGREHLVRISADGTALVVSRPDAAPAQ